MLQWDQYRHLHVIRNLRDLVGNLWKSDIVFLNEEGQFTNPLNESYFYNSSVAAVLKDSHLNKSLSRLLQDQTSKSKELVLLEWEETGMSVLAVPVFFNQKWQGSVGVLGFVSREEQITRFKSVAESFNISDFSVKIVDSNQLGIMKTIVSSLTQEIILVDEVEKSRKHLRDQFLNSSNKYGDLVGNSQSMQNLYSILDKIKDSDSSILIQGENGTGKELVAQSIYQNSKRKNEAFLAQNCSAFNDNLLESELFGHVKGAFTGAIQDKKGLFELADGGTFFLDEIGDTSLTMQAKLLRVLQEGTFFSVGSVKPKKVDVRIIAATNKDLNTMMKQGSFREDLYYRLNVINIKVPSLRERGEDIKLLAEYFLFQESKGQKKVFDPMIFESFNSYAWPGNVRELQNEIQRLVILSHSNERISKELLSNKFFEKEDSMSALSKIDSLKRAVKKLEKQMIERCLKEESWNKTRVAKKLGISRAALISKVKSYELEKKSIA
ncbi:MAG: sigma-54 dependent transcriptional regulator [Bdellovibrionales bacterium]|nr:sigma-54 dependent transcriptional regulator [Bdellovibrionales bacterium]